MSDPKKPKPGAEVLGPFAELLEYQYGPASRAQARKERKAAKGKSEGRPIA
jgi:hypothetical protein